MSDYLHRLQTVYDERFAPEYGPWHPVVAQVADKFLACGVLEHGFARIRCDACAPEHLLAFLQGSIKQLYGLMWPRRPAKASGLRRIDCGPTSAARRGAGRASAAPARGGEGQGIRAWRRRRVSVATGVARVSI